MDLLHEAGDRVDADGNPAIELCHDLMEQSGRAAEDDGFSGLAVVDAALDMMQAGIDAREQVKASSMAAERRNERMMKGTASPLSNDPIDW
tara:strand:- start:21 stop:293 length:273 start_codon:yes stop_codon:yes gene_type:complete